MTRTDSHAKRLIQIVYMTGCVDVSCNSAVKKPQLATDVVNSSSACTIMNNSSSTAENK